MKRVDKNKEISSISITPLMGEVALIGKMSEETVSKNKEVIEKIQTFLNERGYCCKVDGVLSEETIKAFISRVIDCSVYNVKSDILYTKTAKYDLTKTSIVYLYKLCNFIIPDITLKPSGSVNDLLLSAVNDALDFELFKGV